jgi:hypothetical protein
MNGATSISERSPRTRTTQPQVPIRKFQEFSSPARVPVDETASAKARDSRRELWKFALLAIGGGIILMALDIAVAWFAGIF